ncbi:MAG: nuclear transport factor 2 family protein, partial [Chloroflexi bacterium]|nr:nuclear transport factor 2 family protein [Chloroflexota bacterium]
SQAQLRGGLPEPWQTILPWFIRGALVALLICATALSGKPFGSALTAAFVLAWLLIRAAAYVILAFLRLAVALLRTSLRVVLAVVALIAYIGRSLWNWLAGFKWAERAHIGRLGSIDLDEVGGDISHPEAFVGVDAAQLERNKEVMRRLYEEALLSPDSTALDGLVAADLLDHDERLGRVIGRGLLIELREHLRFTYTDPRVHVERQVAENDLVVTRFMIEGTRDRAPVVLHGVDESRLCDGKVVERTGQVGEPAPVELRDGATVGVR